MIPDEVMSEAADAGYADVLEVEVDGKTAYALMPPEGLIVGMPVLYAYDGDVLVMMPEDAVRRFLSE